MVVFGPRRPGVVLGLTCRLGSVGETMDYWGIGHGLGNWVGLVLGLELLGNWEMGFKIG